MIQRFESPAEMEVNYVEFSCYHSREPTGDEFSTYIVPKSKKKKSVNMEMVTRETKQHLAYL